MMHSAESVELEQRDAAAVRASADGWARLITKIFEAGGSAPAEASQIAAHLVEANLSGHDSHGVGAVPTYLKHLAQGKVKPNQAARRVGGEGLFAVYDGGMGWGQPIANQVIREAAGIAKRDGVALVCLRNSHHIGRIGAYGEALAAEGLASVHFVNALLAQPCVAPHNGADARLATNPLCIAIPAREPIVLDFATSAIAMGKVRVALNKDKQVPEGCLIDHAGRPTTAPETIFQAPLGALLPLGGHKGWALAFVIEILGGALTGGGTAQATGSRERGTVNGMFSIVFDPARFVDASVLDAEIEALAAYVKQSPPREAGGRVQLPGEPERETRRRRQEEGFEVDGATWREIAQEALELGVDRMELRAFQSTYS